MITCLVLQSIFLVQNSVAAIVSDGRKFDLYSGMALAAAVILFHIIFILIVAMKVCGYCLVAKTIVTLLLVLGVIATMLHSENG